MQPYNVAGQQLSDGGVPGFLDNHWTMSTLAPQRSNGHNPGTDINRRWHSNSSEITILACRGLFAAMVGSASGNRFHHMLNARDLNMADDIGFIGIGNMGYGMAGNIRQKMPPGATLYVNDILTPTCERFMNEYGGFGPIIIGKAPKEIAEKTKTIVTMLPTGTHVRQVYVEGDTSLFQAPADKDRLFLECSTIEVNSAKEIGKLLREAGKGTYIDAPVSGGVKAAAAGTLSFMVGTVRNDSNPINRRAYDTISMMADLAKITFAGELGTGLAAKIANNYIAFCTSLATAEAMSIGVRSGVEPKTLFDIIRASTGNSWHLGIKPCIPDIIPTAPSSNGYAPAFKPSMVVKDLGLALELARATGIDPRCATAALETYKTASELLCYKDLDCTAVWLLINEKAPPTPETSL
ncbi:hypothetical protein FE257_013001 [Aspergillus nanangensis]|uniref:3-hydroxyisobutyrate dehydrogenase n=1 Tax=Aspergillus nanangensis TaxID=2582783 RepID=A0AAD4CFM5_ASPNN|nr:hypothetical protein FE257_013001 [Aspergillus nanangensis]